MFLSLSRDRISIVEWEQVEILKREAKVDLIEKWTCKQKLKSGGGS